MSALERVEDAIARVPKLGRAGGIYEAELLSVLREADDALRAAYSRLAVAEAVITQTREAVREEYPRRQIIMLLSNPLPPLSRDKGPQS